MLKLKTGILTIKKYIQILQKQLEKDYYLIFKFQN